MITVTVNVIANATDLPLQPEFAARGGCVTAPAPSCTLVIIELFSSSPNRSVFEVATVSFGRLTQGVVAAMSIL